MSQAIYFFGCDIGGWHGDNDGFAVCKWNGKELEHADEKKGSLFWPVSPKVSEEIDKTVKAGAKIIIGIDAALGWPVKFAELAASSPNASHLPEFKLDGAINNPYLYRDTERFVKTKGSMKKGPLSAPGDKFGNNSSKGQALAAWFKDKLKDKLYRPPFDEWDKNNPKNAVYTLIEVYPAASMTSTAFEKLEWPKYESGKIKVPVTSMNALEDKPDISDAKRAAMTCVCYAKTVGLIKGDFPDVYTPEKKDEITKEGWIFFPK